MIDTLWDTDGQRILDQINSIGRSVTDLKNIILTHAHRSHLGGLAALKKASGATVYAHEWEADIISGERKAQGITVVPMRPLRLPPRAMVLSAARAPMQTGWPRFAAPMRALTP